MTERKGTRTVNEIIGIGSGADTVVAETNTMATAAVDSVGLVIDPFNVKTWPPEQQRNHRLRRALHELMESPAYTVEVGQKPDGTPGVRIASARDVSPEASEFLRRYREEFITYLTWLEMVDEYSGVQGEVPITSRKAA